MAWNPASSPIQLPQVQDGQTVAVRGVRNGQPGPEASMRISLGTPDPGTTLTINEGDLGTFGLGATPQVSITTAGGVGSKRQVTYEGDWLPGNLDVDTAYTQFRGTVS